MPVLCQINTVINSGSIGRIAEGIGIIAIDSGYKSYIIYGRNKRDSQSISYNMGGKIDFILHALLTRIFDKHGYGSYLNTKKLIKFLEKINPDIIHLHNIHGYYLNYKLLFNWLAEKKIKVVWTLHDCWSYTGHCACYSIVNCEMWKKECKKCKYKSIYPSSFLFSNSKKNFQRKKKIFTQLDSDKLILVTPSRWLQNEVNSSFLKKYTCKVINNGIDSDLFTNKNFLDNNYYILGLANTWEERKGLKDFIKLSNYLKDNEKIVLIGLNDKQIKNLPNNILGLKRTESIDELVSWYSRSLVFVNLTYSDNYPTTNIEALACGTPIITYNTDGSPEIIDKNTGYVVDKGDIEDVYRKIQTIETNGKKFYSTKCRKLAIEKYDMRKKFQEYTDLYNVLLSNKYDD